MKPTGNNALHKPPRQHNTTISRQRTGTNLKKGKTNHEADHRAVRKRNDKIATQAQLGECYYLVGDLGAGKTCFARGFIQSLGIIEDVTSPTYSLINSYSAVLGDIHHLDLYRLTDDVDYCQSGLDDTDTDNSIWLIEWPQRCPDSIPRATHTLTFLCQDSVCPDHSW